jgi:hypothetical protein
MAITETQKGLLTQVMTAYVKDYGSRLKLKTEKIKIEFVPKCTGDMQIHHKPNEVTIVLPLTTSTKKVKGLVESALQQIAKNKFTQWCVADQPSTLVKERGKWHKNKKTLAEEQIESLVAEDRIVVMTTTVYMVYDKATKVSYEEEVSEGTEKLTKYHPLSLWIGISEKVEEHEQSQKLLTVNVNGKTE